MKWMAPIVLRRDSLKPAHVEISLRILRVVSIKEEDHSISLQLEITLKWHEYRVKYHNLKTDHFRNAVSSSDMEKLWLPLVIFTNTEQLETTRLGENWEWTTNLWVEREKSPRRPDRSWLDETEIFKGSENKLIMEQSYTHEFQCTFQLQHYPFDAQVIQRHNMGLVFKDEFRCATLT